MSKGNATILIIGAGADKTMAIEMPLANQLIPEVARFSEKEGKGISDTIKSFLPQFRFSFNKFIHDAIDSIIKQGENQTQFLIEKLREQEQNSGIAEDDRKLARLIIRLLEKIRGIGKESRLDNEIFELVQEVFGEKLIEKIEDESIIELSKITFSDSFKTIMRTILKKSLKEFDNQILRILSSQLLDIENLLVETFLGFYNRNTSDIKKYLYISWMLWAYLKFKENTVLSRLKTKNMIPFYSSIPESIRVISFNYTTFLSKVRDKNNYLYFHGSLDKYLEMDHRDVLPIEEELSTVEDIIEFLKKYVEGNIDFDNAKYVIPLIIPPLKLKPVLSNEFIEVWYRANEWIEKAKNLIIVGYSFNYADEHFNDIIRKKQGKKICVINPDAENIMMNLSKIYGFNPSNYNKISMQGKEAFKCQNIHIVKAKADEINLHELCN